MKPTNLSLTISLAVSLIVGSPLVSQALPGSPGGGENGVIRFSSAVTNSSLPPDWNYQVENVLDGDPSTVYSSEKSQALPTNGPLPLANTADSQLAVQFAPDAGAQSINAVRLTPRYQGGELLGFPLRYEIKVTTPDGSDWVSVGTFCEQPTGAAPIVVTFPAAYETRGVIIRPLDLGLDNYEAPYFQLADIEAISGSGASPSADCR